jgi:hypothetical protein
MIDKVNGSILLYDNLQVFRGMKLEELQAKIDKNKIYKNFENDLPWIGLHPQKDVDHYFIICISFDQRQKICSLDLIINDKNDLLSWEGWSEEREMKRKAAHDSWLIQELGEYPPYNYEWGLIESYYEPRNAASLIVITYKND